MGEGGVIHRKNAMVTSGAMQLFSRRHETLGAVVALAHIV